jgi:ankyrin repeat protein
MLLGAIASRDRVKALEMLEQSPGLVRAVVEDGDVFFDEITHYAYVGDTALHMAAAAYLLPVARHLVVSGAAVRARNRRGAEPLHYACDGIPGSRAWDPEAQGAVVRFLIRIGADPNAVDKGGVAPLHRAVRMRSTAAVRALLEGGADVRFRNKSGSTPLDLASRDTGRGGAGSVEAREEQATIIRLLLDHAAR